MYSSMMGRLTQGYLVNVLGYVDDKTLYNTFNLNIKGDKDRKDIIFRIVYQELQNGHVKIDSSLTMIRLSSQSLQVKDKETKVPQWRLA